ncbi:hypothetical protein OB13_11675 [Pontibacter sp. HJ8]
MRWIRSVKLLAQQLGAKVVFMGGTRTLNNLKAAVKASKPAIDAEYLPRPTMTAFEKNEAGIAIDDMVVVILARRGTVSYSSQLDYVPRLLSRNYKENSFIIMYPEQHPVVYQDNQYKTTGYTNETTAKENF